MPKRVVVHIGFHKTGTSAVQAVLAENADLLREHGVAYPYPDPPSVVAAGGCSGNVIQILFRDNHMLAEKPIAPTKLGVDFYKSLRQVIDDQPEDTVLISGEYLGRMQVDQLRLMQQAFEGLKVDIFCFVRDPFDFAFSAWRQVTKDGNKQTFLEYISDGSRTFSMREGMLAYASVFDKNLTVLRYETHRKDVAGAFLRAAGLVDTLPSPTRAAGRTHNPSLSPSEAALCVACARAYGSKNVGRFVARSLLSRSKRREFSYYNRTEHQDVIDSFGPAVAKMNEYLPESDRIVLALRDTPDTPTPISETDAEFVAHLIAAHQGKKQTLWQALRARIKHRGLPRDFDAEAYLVLNPDLQLAGVDPAEHYLLSGQKEARPYKVF